MVVSKRVKMEVERKKKKYFGTGATGLEPATFGFGDRRSTN